MDETACATRAVAGLRTLRADVSTLSPGATLALAAAAEVEALEMLLADPALLERVYREQGEPGLWGLIASPPCQAFSMAGQGHGRRALAAYEEAIARLLEGSPLSREELDERCEDERAHLVLEPLRWALELRPVWVACEQVEPVLPLWDVMGGGLRKLGYSVWTGVLSAERYGVPQTRRRAILLARRDSVEAREPPATHRRYIAPRRRAVQDESLFDAPEPERIVEAGESNLLPWVSMAEALGWSGPDDEVGFPRRNDVEGDAADYRERDLRPATEPAFALTEKARSWTRFRSNSRANATERDLDEPAPTITGGHDHAERTWITRRFTDCRSFAAPASYNSRDQRDTRTGAPVYARQRSVDEPAPTIAGESSNDSWTHDRPVKTVTSHGLIPAPGQSAFNAEMGRDGWEWDRPATTVTGDPRISEPGHHDSKVSGSQQANAVRVSVAEAAVLQSFPPDYPWQGTRTKVFQQIGNAVPPLLAFAVLREVVA
jgi:DNA (cytosine-5)-methyltransferase 1